MKKLESNRFRIFSSIPRPQLLEGIAGLELLGLLTIGPLVVARRIDNRLLELLKLKKNLAAPIGIRGGYRRQNVSAGTGLAAGMDIANVNDETDLVVRIDRVDQKRRVGQQILIVGPVAKNSDDHLVVAVVVVAIPGRRAMLDSKRRGQDHGGTQKPFHDGRPK
jgi:hypothetical protein